MLADIFSLDFDPLHEASRGVALLPCRLRALNRSRSPDVSAGDVLHTRVQSFRLPGVRASLQVCSSRITAVFFWAKIIIFMCKDPRPGREHNQTLDYVIKLANIARPDAEFFQQTQSARRKSKPLSRSAAAQSASRNVGVDAPRGILAEHFLTRFAPPPTVKVGLFFRRALCVCWKTIPGRAIFASFIT